MIENIQYGVVAFFYKSRYDLPISSNIQGPFDKFPIAPMGLRIDGDMIRLQGMILPPGRTEQTDIDS